MARQFIGQQVFEALRDPALPFVEGAPGNAAGCYQALTDMFSPDPDYSNPISINDKLLMMFNVGESRGIPWHVHLHQYLQLELPALVSKNISEVIEKNMDGTELSDAEREKIYRCIRQYCCHQWRGFIDPAVTRPRAHDIRLVGPYAHDIRLMGPFRSQSSFSSRPTDYLCVWDAHIINPLRNIRYEQFFQTLEGSIIACAGIATFYPNYPDRPKTEEQLQGETKQYLQFIQDVQPAMVVELGSSDKGQKFNRQNFHAVDYPDGVECISIPVSDLTPIVWNAKNLNHLRFVHTVLRRGKNVVVHSISGAGRTGEFIFALVIFNRLVNDSIFRNLVCKLSDGGELNQAEVQTLNEVFKSTLNTIRYRRYLVQTVGQYNNVVDNVTELYRLFMSEGPLVDCSGGPVTQDEMGELSSPGEGSGSIFSGGGCFCCCGEKDPLTENLNPASASTGSQKL